MTEQELAGLKELALRVFSDTAPHSLVTPETLARIRQACVALGPVVEEVHRLRALVESAYEEGRKEGGSQSQGGFCTGDYPESWSQSKARAALGDG